MASFRILNQAPQYLLADGSVNAGGSLTFYETDLTTPKDTWSDEAMTTLNSNPVVMDAAGRTLTDVWGDGEYGVVMKDADDVVIWTRNNVKQSGDAGAAIPALQDGEFLTNDGSVLSWQPIIQVPDPTGHSGQVLYSDGAIPYWAALPVTPDPPEPDIVVTDTSFQAGTSDDNTKFFTLSGTGTGPNTGTKQSSVAIAFPTSFDILESVLITITTASTTPSSFIPTWSVTGWTPGSASSGVTVNFNIPDDDSNANFKFSTTIPFAWQAFGKREVAP